MVNLEQLTPRSDKNTNLSFRYIRYRSSIFIQKALPLYSRNAGSRKLHSKKENRHPNQNIANLYSFLHCKGSATRPIKKFKKHSNHEKRKKQ